MNQLMLWNVVISSELQVLYEWVPLGTRSAKYEVGLDLF